MERIFDYLVIVSECMQKVVEVLIVHLLEVLSHGCDDSQLAVLPTQVRPWRSAVHEVANTILIRLDENTKCVIGRHMHGVLDAAIRDKY